ncbi:MAG: rRNA pseudouridine synthase [Lentisphaeria bacterium]|nr:rRNA pseudouridine synthase [Lentisphaeria bacterium]
MDNLIKFISSSGAASRRQAEKLIRAGRVTVDGAVNCDPAYRVSPENTVLLDGRKVEKVTNFRYFLLNKPRGYVCSNADDHAEKLAVDLFAGISEKLVSAGRLDKESQGAIIFSNDGNFINRLTHPRYGVLKKYHVYTDGVLSEKDLAGISSGIRDNGDFLKAEKVTPLSDGGYEFILNEGKKREIRRLTAACGCPTLRLIRKEIGAVKLGNLPAGKFRELTGEEIKSLLGENSDV